MLTSESYGPLLPKKQPNDLVASSVFPYWNLMNNILIKCLHLVPLNICCFEAISCANVCKIRVYFDALNQDWIYLEELFLRWKWCKQQVSGCKIFLEVQIMGEDRRLRESNSGFFKVIHFLGESRVKHW